MSDNLKDDTVDEAPEVDAPDAPDAPVVPDEAPAPTPEAPTPSGPPPKPDNIPSAGVIPVTGQSNATTLQGPTTPQQTSQYLKSLQNGVNPITKTQETSQELKDQDAAWGNDLVNGHIEPHTYADLFAKKSTLGKISTLFGLIVSGAGAGLAHQTNAVADMMDKELRNDVEAQKQSKANAQNFIKLNQQHQLEQSQIGVNEAQQKIFDQEAKIKGDALGHMQANRTALHDLALKSGFVPDPINGMMVPPANPTPQQQQAIQTYGVMTQLVDGMNSNIADKAAGMTALLHSTSAAQGNSQDNGVDLDKLKNLTLQGKLGVPTALDAGQAGSAHKEAELVQSNRLITNNYVKAFNALDKKILAGKVNKKDYDAYVEPIADQLAKQYNLGKEDKDVLKNALFPSPTDWGPSRKDALKQGLEHLKTLEATPTLDQFGLKKPFPTYQESRLSPMEGKTATNAEGKKVIMKSGKWVPFTGGK